MGKVLTFAIPCYNMEQYLDQCIRSILAPQLMEKIEILIVDDGSTDSSYIIAQKYMNEYPDTVVAIHKENGGHGSAINTAIDRACGTYFKVLDADDWVVSENLERLLAELEQTRADVIINSFESVHMKTQTRTCYSVGQNMNGSCISMQQLLKAYAAINACCSIHGIIYRTDFYRKTGLTLSEKVFYEDSEYATLPFCYVNSVLLLDFVLYQYRIGNSNQSVASKNQVKRIDHYIQVANKMIDYFIAAADIPAENQEYVARKISALITTVYAVALVRNPNKREGRKIADNFRAEMLQKCSSLWRRSERKYKILRLANWLHMPVSIYTVFSETRFYRHFRQWWAK